VASGPQGDQIKSKELVVAALLAAGCSDALIPSQRATELPSFATEAGGSIALWGFNGTLPPQSGTTLGKEFNPENPPLGSTVVATFVWVGSTNVIDSVADFLWTGRRVGNRYTLVEYITLGGISMATYVATNVQNYPVPKRVLGEELVINAYLRSPVSAGGALVSAYTGVDPVFAQGLGAHRSASGSGSSTPTNAHPGAITVGAGAFVYAVSMTSDGLAGRTAPAGFTYMTGLATESPSMQFDVEYALRSVAGSVDPTWGWSFRSPNTWLASALALNPTGSVANQPPTAAFTPGCTALTCSFTSTSSDPDGTIAGYGWTFGDGTSSAAQNPSHTYAAGGTFTVTLTVTDNQGATNATSRTVTVAAANQSPTAAFTFSCPGGGPSCSFTSTSSDPDGTVTAYSWTFGDGGTSVAQNPSHTYAAGGTYTVRLTVTDNQGATNATSRTVTVAAANQSPTATFTFSCPGGGPSCSFTSTSSDPDGTIGAYSWSFGDGGTATTQNASHTYGAAGTYTVTLTVTDNQGATGSTSRSVGINLPNQPPVASFTFSCAGGGPTCSFTNTSSDPDGTIAASGWSFGDGGTAATQNASHTYGAAGTYTVTLTVTDNQGATGATSRSVAVSLPNQLPVASFTFGCAGGGPTCSFTSTSSDPDGTINAYNWTFGDGGTAATPSPSHTYGAAGTFTVTLTVTDNRGGTNATSRSVTVSAPSGGGGPVAFDREVANLEVFPGGSTQIIKGFNPINPRVGDAIVATFFWFGSTNIIQSVTDHLTDPGFTPVGNTYHLVEYRTAGGISMATYVATNVQNVPLANQEQSNVLAVRANFTQSITRGGIQLSSYSGVAPNYSSALSASQSASGAGTGITPADPGAVTVNPGALVYAVTMSNGVFGSDTPGAPFTSLTGTANSDMVTNASYAVPAGGGSIHPQWIYHFDGGTYSWLATVLALNPAP
jgi:PKD repeat protein